ncbi:hypothetical protein QWY85_03495 [Neolewinella lacunae]|uniref:Uncharacterized protein n=1 Tax=Neolewinella lacunae TaxID=1517758 RepID=A0A923PHY5_9BACT|nr:hypothetical protein [Neolewinella lacunae]MBC6992930.1 hypothetical protein [Neolewinella lacunae]MDN3633706.1 hypothetical protein [Neolewinella lacunae]
MIFRIHPISRLCVLLLAIAMISWTSCGEINNLSGGNTVSGPDPNEILRVCYDGWTENPDTKVCECLPPKVVIGKYECRTVEANDWYSSMSGCLVDQGFMLQITGPVHPDSITRRTTREIFIELPDSTSNRRFLSPTSMRYLPRGDRFDSIQLYVPSFAHLPYFVRPTYTPNGYTDGYNTGFHGIILNDSTLVGQFVFGPMYDSWEIDRSRIFSRCDAVIRKGRVE